MAVADAGSIQLHADRQRRRAGAGGWRDRHRVGRQLRAGGGAGADDRGWAGRGGHRAPGHADRGRYLRLHQPLRHSVESLVSMDVPTYSPREIVGELDRFIVGQNDAKRAVAIALRNRWRRQQLPDGMREEVVPKNILMIGPTGCGKTEIARRLAKLAQAPFIKVEATKFTEVGYVGRDVDSIMRDLVEASASRMLRESRAARTCRPRRSWRREDRLVTALVGEGASADTRTKFRRMLRAGELEDKEVETGADGAGGACRSGQIDMPGMPPAQMANIGEMMKGMFGRKEQRKRMTVAAARGGAGAGGGGPLLDTDAADQGRGAACRGERDRLPRRDRQGVRPQQRGRLPGRRRVARRRAAGPAAADRGHDGEHEVWSGEERPRAVHRLGRVPPGEARGPAAGAAGAVADPGGAGSRCRGTTCGAS